MMGRQDRDQRQLFYEFSLDEMIPRGHLCCRRSMCSRPPFWRTCTNSWRRCHRAILARARQTGSRRRRVPSSRWKRMSFRPPLVMFCLDPRSRLSNSLRAGFFAPARSQCRMASQVGDSALCRPQRYAKKAPLQCSAIPQNGPIPPTAAHGAGHVPLVRVALTAEAYPA